MKNETPRLLTGNWTSDLWITRQTLYQLSYRSCGREFCINIQYVDGNYVHFTLPTLLDWKKCKQSLESKRGPRRSRNRIRPKLSMNWSISSKEIAISNNNFQKILQTSKFEGTWRNCHCCWPSDFIFCSGPWWHLRSMLGTTGYLLCIYDQVPKHNNFFLYMQRCILNIQDAKKFPSTILTFLNDLKGHFTQNKSGI